ncbi:hypothetical protein LX32DRAFT_13212 [Colletotrichum zoysiae]|uniref:Uncharacterized protein n=1 Tax=Colletotrichum zoysiae TaxID=1216348 RepID=A0AAD9HD53_9PEZI|nr:hypothetical protein LX32DRAFT_13212 [Colletotrichum zoysiae]
MTLAKTHHPCRLGFFSLAALPCQEREGGNACHCRLVFFSRRLLAVIAYNAASTNLDIRCMSNTHILPVRPELKRPPPQPGSAFETGRPALPCKKR